VKEHLLKHVSPELRALLSDSERNSDLLADGETLRIPMSMMDAKTGKPLKLADGKQVPLHRAGWRVKGSLCTDSKHAERQAVYDSYDAEMGAAYKTGFGSTPSTELRGDRPGDACTVRGREYPWAFGSEGRLDENLVCVPLKDPRRRADAAPKDAKVLRDEAYDSYNEFVTNAWKGADTKKRKKVQYRDPEGREEGTAEEVDDSRSVADKTKNHAANMRRLYEARDRELSEMWKGK
jgi:hypothetical protein